MGWCCFLILVASFVKLTISQKAQCQCNSSDISKPCEMPINEWLNASITDPNPYTCNMSTDGQPPYTLMEAAMSNRTRRNVLDMTPMQVHRILRAWYCAQSYGSSHANISDYMNDSWYYVATFHGEPGWFPQCFAGNRAGNEAPGCCPHSNPTFPGWHRLLMVQYENSLRRWDLDESVALPYWDWTDDMEYRFPVLLSNQTYYDSIVQKVVRNPFYTVQTPTAIYEYNAHHNYSEEGNNDPNTNGECSSTPICNYTCRAPSPEIFFRADSTYGVGSWAEQIFQSYMTTNFIVFDRNFEMPHNNIHNLIGGNMPNNWYVGLEPIFTYHHSNIERLFLIWQKTMELQGQDFRKKLTWHKNLGCFINDLGLELSMKPFYTGDDYNYNSDPITSKFSANAWYTMNYQDMYYSYDSLDLVNRTIQDINESINNGGRETGTGGNERISLGWHFKYLYHGYTIDWKLYSIGDTALVNSLADGSFSCISRVNDVHTEYGVPRYLYEVDITSELASQDFSLNSSYFYVNFSITTLTHNVSYTKEEAGVYQPFVIHRYSDGREIIRILWGNDFDYQDMNIILSSKSDIADVINNTYIELVQIGDAETNITIDYHYFYDPDTVFYSYEVDEFFTDIYSNAFPEIANNFTFSTALLPHSTFTNASDVVLLSYYLVTNKLYVTNVSDDVSGKIYSYGKNRIRNNDLENSSISFYSNVAIYSKFNPLEVFNETLILDTSDNVSLNWASTENSIIEMPWSYAFAPGVNRTENDLGLYNRTWSQATLSMITFISCASNSEYVCQVDNQEKYDACNASNSNCGYNIYAAFEEGNKRFWFISNDSVKCMDGGFKIAFDVADPPEPTPYCMNCDDREIKATMSPEIDGNTYSIVQYLYDDCWARFVISGDFLHFQWIGFGFFGVWEDGTVTNGMKGWAVVLVRYWENVAWFELVDIGVHPFKRYMKQTPSDTADDCKWSIDDSGEFSFDCYINVCGLALKTHWTKYIQNDNKISTSTTYTGVITTYNGSTPGFSIKHNGFGSYSYRYTYIYEDDDVEGAGQLRISYVVYCVVSWWLLLQL